MAMEIRIEKPFPATIVLCDYLTRGAAKKFIAAQAGHPEIDFHVAGKKFQEAPETLTAAELVAMNDFLDGMGVATIERIESKETVTDFAAFVDRMLESDVVEIVKHAMKLRAGDDAAEKKTEKQPTT